MKTLRDYKPARCLLSNGLYSEFAATDPGSQEPIRLVQFSEALSSQDGFRAAFRKDLPTLKALKHFHILRVLDCGESNGTLFYTTEAPEGERLSAQTLKQLTWDQLTDLARQLSSAIQHAHNLGISHGDLSAECVFASPEIRVQVGAFGIQPWADLAAGVAFDEFRRHEVDSQRIAIIIRDLVKLVSAAEQPQLAPLKSLLDAVLSAPQQLTARDIQRRLGDMLLRDSDADIELIDDRAGQAVNRRSLVDELFEDLPVNATRDSDMSKTGNWLSWKTIASLFTLLALLALVIWSVMA